MRNARHKADTELVRQQNRSLVLEALRKYGTLASIELGEKTKLSPATISAITNDMLSERLIETDKEQTAKIRSAQRGRPKVKLRLASRAAVVIGVRVTHNVVSLLAADFCGNKTARADFELETTKLSADEFGQKLTESVLVFMEDNKISPSHVSIISVACQGSVDTKKGEIIWSPAFSARNIPITQPLKDAIGAPCIVANDTNAIAHVLHVEDDEGLDSFAVIYLGSGIGMGLYVNNALLEGADGSASEFGHMLSVKDGAKCRCGRNGCIEAYAADFGIYRTANPDLAEKDPATLTPTKAEMDKLANGAREGDKTAQKAFARAGTAIGDGLNHLTMLVNPRCVMLTGPGISQFDLMRESMEAELDHSARNGKRLKIKVLDDDRDLIEDGLLALAFTQLDREIFSKRVSVEDVAARQGLISA